MSRPAIRSRLTSNVRMYYGSGTVDRIASGQHVHTPGGSTFLREMKWRHGHHLESV